MMHDYVSPYRRCCCDACGATTVSLRGSSLAAFIEFDLYHIIIIIIVIIIIVIIISIITTQVLPSLASLTLVRAPYRSPRSRWCIPSIHTTSSRRSSLLGRGAFLTVTSREP